MWYRGRGCSWALLLPMGGGGRVAACGFFVHLVCVVLENPGTSCPICWYYLSEVFTLCVPRSCVALGINNEWSVSCLYLETLRCWNYVFSLTQMCVVHYGSLLTVCCHCFVSWHLVLCV